MATNWSKIGPVSYFADVNIRIQRGPRIPLAGVPAASHFVVGGDDSTRGLDVIDQKCVDVRPKALRRVGKGLGVPHM
ncbi:hypothetical protein O6P37_14705 [Mycobacterium sp. CPCC 205372]|uniref:Uncharacterized protein n=1 Tax=Mycobacterium hippophais TaxID=3016340 RepID=A0ABT4PUA7_9MYCO|nr:hypothetical protein [Mycobacterium hippophais]MCZ8380120.1 hypothetical protein [Mycobacterium hippophais]